MQISKRLLRLFLSAFIVATVFGFQATSQEVSAIRRIERLEDDSKVYNAQLSKLVQIAEQQQTILQELISANAKQEERIDLNSEALQKIAIAAETVKQSQEDFADRITWIGTLFVSIVIVSGFVLDRLREKRMKNGGNPLIKPIADLEERLLKSEVKIHDLLKEILLAQSRPQQRTRRPKHS